MKDIFSDLTEHAACLETRAVLTAQCHVPVTTANGAVCSLQAEPAAREGPSGVQAPGGRGATCPGPQRRVGQGEPAQEVGLPHEPARGSPPSAIPEAGLPKGPPHQGPEHLLVIHASRQRAPLPPFQKLTFLPTFFLPPFFPLSGRVCSDPGPSHLESPALV